MSVPMFRRNLFVASPALRGDDVLALQQGLLAQGFRVEADGIFGVGTRAAVLAFQARHALSQDGMAGPATWSALFAAGDEASLSAVPDAARQCFDYLTAESRWTPPQACGIVANIEHESRFKPDQFGDGNRAYGIAQWHPDRQAEFQQHAGKPIYGTSLLEQLEFLHWEMTKGREYRAGKRLKGATTAREAGEIVSRYYERPAAADLEARTRGMCAEGYFARFGSRANAEPAPSPIRTAVAPAKTLGDIFGREQVRELQQPHRLFRSGNRWLVSEEGVQIEDRPIVQDPAAEQCVRDVMQAYAPALYSALADGRVPIELVLAAICAVHDLRGEPQLSPGADRRNPDRTPDSVSAGLMQTTLGAARLATGNAGLSLNELTRPDMAIRAGAGSMWLRAVETGYDPPLVAAMYNVGELRNDLRSRWGLLQYGLGGRDYIDEFVRCFNAAMKISQELEPHLPPSVASFHRWIDAGYDSKQSPAGYVADNPQFWIGPRPVGNGQCVALVREATGAPAASTWRCGDRVSGQNDLQVGAAIASFDPDGSYGNHTDGHSHAALYVSQDGTGIRVVDQWLGQAPHERVIRFNNTDPRPANQGEAFHVVL